VVGKERKGRPVITHVNMCAHVGTPWLLPLLRRDDRHGVDRMSCILPYVWRLGWEEL
jgi:hypothetical protein